MARNGNNWMKSLVTIRMRGGARGEQGCRHTLTKTGNAERGNKDKKKKKKKTINTKGRKREKGH